MLSYQSWKSAEWSNVCRAGKVGRQILSTIYQYNHQNGSLNLPVEGYSRHVPIAIKVSDMPDSIVHSWESLQARKIAAVRISRPSIELKWYLIYCVRLLMQYCEAPENVMG